MKRSLGAAMMFMMAAPVLLLRGQEARQSFQITDPQSILTTPETDEVRGLRTYRLNSGTVASVSILMKAISFGTKLMKEGEMVIAMENGMTVLLDKKGFFSFIDAAGAPMLSGKKTRLLDPKTKTVLGGQAVADIGRALGELIVAQTLPTFMHAAPALKKGPHP